MARIIKFEGRLISVPDDATDAEVAEIVGGGVPSEPTSQTWGQTASQAVSNLIPSTVDLVKNVASAITSPVETAKGVMDIAAGGLQNALPKGVVDYINAKFPSESAEEARTKADAVGKFYVDRYGSIEGFKRALGKDPAGVMADAATVLSGGSGLATKAGLTRTGEVLNTAARAVDPLLQSVKVAEKVIKPVGSGIANVVGGIGTHTGGESIKDLAAIGYKGGKDYKSAAAQLRETAPVTDVLDKAQTALTNIMQKRSAEYVNAMKQVNQNQGILNFGDIDNSVQKALSINTFKGKSISPTTTAIQDDIVKVVDDWKKSNPADFHTIEGFDALKRAIGNIRDTTEFGTPARRVADTVYNSIKDTIVKLDPEYAKVMQQYSEASETISEIQRHLLGKDKGSPITSMRKLQNLMTAGGKNKSMELNLAKQLEDAGASGLKGDLAGMSMQGWVPRMLSGRLGAGIGTAIAASQNPALALGLLPLQSPRLVGETALMGGRAAGMIGKGVDMGRGATSAMFGNIPYDLYLAQMDRLREASENQQ
jgi:hypothetical protein